MPHHIPISKFWPNTSSRFHYLIDNYIYGTVSNGHFILIETFWYFLSLLGTFFSILSFDTSCTKLSWELVEILLDSRFYSTRKISIILKTGTFLSFLNSFLTVLRLLKMTKIHLWTPTHSAKSYIQKAQSKHSLLQLGFCDKCGFSQPMKEFDPVRSLLFCAIHSKATISMPVLYPLDSFGRFFSHCCSYMEPKPTSLSCCKSSSRWHSLLSEINGLLITWDDTSRWFSHRLVLVAACINACVPVKGEHFNSCLTS